MYLTTRAVLYWFGVYSARMLLLIAVALLVVPSGYAHHRFTLQLPSKHYSRHSSSSPFGSPGSSWFTLPAWLLSCLSSFLFVYPVLSHLFPSLPIPSCPALSCPALFCLSLSRSSCPVCPLQTFCRDCLSACLSACLRLSACLYTFLSVCPRACLSQIVSVCHEPNGPAT